MSAAYAKAKILLTPDCFKPVVSPINCNYFALRNTSGGELLIRTDLGSADTEDTLAQDASETVMSATKYRGEGTRFAQGEIVMWAKSVGRSGPIVITWVI